MDLFTFLTWTLLFYLAYKLGVYVERKMQAKKEALQTVDPERLTDPMRSDPPHQMGEQQVKEQAATAEKGSG